MDARQDKAVKEASEKYAKLFEEQLTAMLRIGFKVKRGQGVPADLVVKFMKEAWLDGFESGFQLGKEE